jgi:formimidoylglutamate deiminase
MYDLVDQLDEDSAYSLSRQAFEEMLNAGFTSVGEFHYIHHAPQKPWSLDAAVLAAARDAGIRLVLLHADYLSGDIDAPLSGAQLRFDTGDAAEYLASLDAVMSKLEGNLQTIGMVCHSIRAAPIDRFVQMKEESRHRGVVFHMHLEEVLKEIEVCRAAYGVGPMRLMLDHGIIDQHTTAVHCTHSRAEDLADFGALGGTVCLCPITEGNLGDGIADVASMRESGCRICIGTDLNSRISPTEELRWMEYVQRVNRQVRGVVVDDSGSTGSALIECGTANGAAALGLNSGIIEAGREADFVAIDLTHSSLAGVQPKELANAIILGTDNEVVAGTCVGGHWLRGGPLENS